MAIRTRDLVKVQDVPEVKAAVAAQDEAMAAQREAFRAWRDAELLVKQRIGELETVALAALETRQQEA